MAFGKTAVESKTGETTDVELDGVDDVADPVQDFGKILCIVGKDTNVGHMSTRAEDDELDSEPEKDPVKSLWRRELHVSFVYQEDDRRRSTY